MPYERVLAVSDMYGCMREGVAELDEAPCYFKHFGSDILARDYFGRF